MSYIHLQIEELKKDWFKVFWNISKNDKSTFDSLKRSDYVEFFYILDEFEADLERQKAQMK